MKINSLLNLRTNEKIDSKVSTNGIIWLRKGEYSSRIKSMIPNGAGSVKREKTAAELRISEVQSLAIHQPDNYKHPQLQSICTKKGGRQSEKSRCKLYSINKRKVRARLQNFMNTDYGDSNLYFYTVTFAKGTSEQVGTKLINSVLTVLRSRYQVEHYLWIKERQKNGTIHYHICIFHYVRVRIINELVKKYIKHGIRKGTINWSTTAANNYNGVDIAKDRKTRIPTNFSNDYSGKRITSYITKYITKSCGEFKGKAWSSSSSLACVSDGICCTIEEVLTMYSSEIINDNAVYENEWCFVFRWKKEAPPDITATLRAINNERILNVSLPLRGFGI